MTRRAGTDGLGALDAIAGAARDLLTDPHGATRVAANAALSVSIGSQGLITAVDHSPPTPACDALVGARVGFGFRSSMRDLLAELDSSLLGLLVDDLSGAPAPSGYGSIRERVVLGLPSMEPPPAAETDAERRRFTQTDVCAGWRAEGEATRSRLDGRELPFAETPPAAPDLAAGPDPSAWHELGTPSERQSRRVRRLDVWRDGDRVLVDAMFRDSTVDPDEHLTQRVVHEYSLRAVVSADLSEILEIRAEPRSLPFAADCPLAADSAQLLVGAPPADLRSVVRAVSRGPISCTHLNDLFRSLADIPHLVALVDRSALTDQRDQPNQTRETQ